MAIFKKLFFHNQRVDVATTNPCASLPHPAAAVLRRRTWWNQSLLPKQQPSFVMFLEIGCGKSPNYESMNDDGRGKISSGIRTGHWPWKWDEMGMAAWLQPRKHSEFTKHREDSEHQICVDVF